MNRKSQEGFHVRFNRVFRACNNTPVNRIRTQDFDPLLPKKSSMNYNPQPLNESASNVVNKSDFIFYGTQIALSQAIKPIDYYVHFRIQENPELDTSNDTKFMFANTMRAPLSDFSATVT
ncbi:hypothetical protein AYI70_g9928 [Smittium culicis]|uniref:Uncharacterized protein n=1 Tax=Smittium culicis TaxID=133412 RepID=A0A1R1X906_9FUNG|nr:hypothetical protein AYI70_g9928 [Smittium culicis]